MFPIMDPSQAPILQCPAAIIADIVLRLPLASSAALALACSELHHATENALAGRTSYWSSDQRELSHLKATRLFRYLARRCPSLRTISVCYAADRLYGGSLLDSSLGALFAGVPHLSHLTLLNVDVTDAVMHQLARQCPLLRHLAIGRTECNAFGNFASDGALTVLAAACQHLDSLCLFRCYSCSDAGLAELTKQGRHLTNLVLHSCPQVTAAGLVKLVESTPGLQQLDVLMPEAGPGGAAVTFDTCFALAAQCPTLKVLRLSEEQLSGGVLDDACVSVIARGCTQLQELELVQVEVTDAALAALATHCTQLTSLRLEQTYVGDEGVQKVLAACPLLQELRVAGCSTHSWMLPAEYMFAGLSVSGLTRMAAAKGVGTALTSLDLSCLAYEPPQQQQAELAVLQELLLPAAALPAAAAEPEVAVAGEAAAEASLSDGAGGSELLSTSLPSSSGSSSSGSILNASDAGSSSSSSYSYSSVASAIARLSIDSPSGSTSSSSRSSPARKAGWDTSTHQLPAEDSLAEAASSSLCTQQGLACPSLDPSLTTVYAPLVPVGWCRQLVSLSLDWLKVDGSMLQGPLQATLRCCSSVNRLSLVGYSGDVDALLSCVADAGAAVTHLGLQHSQVTDAGLAVAAKRLPGLQMLFLSYCRQVGDAGLEHVLGMARLEELDLYNTPCVSAAAVARIARYSRSLRRLYIGHNTSALNRTPAQSTAMGFISSGDRSKYAGGTSSVWAAVSEAAVCRVGGQHLSVLCRNPSSESDFEKRTLQQLLGGGCDVRDSL